MWLLVHSTLFDVDVEGYTKAQSQAAFKGLIGTAPAQQGPHYTQWVDEIWHHLNYSSPMFDILVVNGTQTLPEIVFDIEPDNKVGLGRGCAAVLVVVVVVCGNGAPHLDCNVLLARFRLSWTRC